METKYDYIVNFLLDNWIIAIIVFIAGIIMALPQLRDGVKLLLSAKKDDAFIIEYADEKIICETLLRSVDFDIVKIRATTHRLGVHAEREWLKKFYPDYQNNMQLLDHKTINDGRVINFDIFPIRKGDKKKDIYFDITDFYKGAHVPYSGEVNRYAEQKIKEIYDEKK